MNIKKFSQFINEEFNDTPETYIETTLQMIKKKIDKMFEYQEEREESEESQNKSVQAAKAEGKGQKESMTFKDLGLRLESSEISKYSKQYDNLTVKFSDDENTYNLFIMIELKEAMPKDPDKDFSTDDIEKCYIKFKKYNIDTFDVIGQLAKNAKIKDIDEEFLINLKIELDEKFGEEGEEFAIETE
jgi:hypothetical protein